MVERGYTAGEVPDLPAATGEILAWVRAQAGFRLRAIGHHVVLGRGGSCPTGADRSRPPCAARRARADPPCHGDGPRRAAGRLLRHRLRAALAAGQLAAALGGLDAFVITGGIGENAVPVRAAIAERLAWLGAELDAAANAAGALASRRQRAAWRPWSCRPTRS